MHAFGVARVSNPRTHNVLFALHVLNINSFFSARLSMLAPFNYHESWWAGDMDHHGNTLAHALKRCRIMKVMWKFGYASAAAEWQPESKHPSPGEHLLAIGFLELESGSRMQLGCCLVMEYFHKSYYLGTAVNQFPP